MARERFWSGPASQTVKGPGMRPWCLVQLLQQGDSLVCMMQSFFSDSSCRHKRALASTCAAAWPCLGGAGARAAVLALGPASLLAYILVAEMGWDGPAPAALASMAAAAACSWINGRDALTSASRPSSSIRAVFFSLAAVSLELPVSLPACLPGWKPEVCGAVHMAAVAGGKGRHATYGRLARACAASKHPVPMPVCTALSCTRWIANRCIGVHAASCKHTTPYMADAHHITVVRRAAHRTAGRMSCR